MRYASAFAVTGFLVLAFALHGQSTKRLPVLGLSAQAGVGFSNTTILTASYGASLDVQLLDLEGTGLQFHTGVRKFYYEDPGRRLGVPLEVSLSRHDDFFGIYFGAGVDYQHYRNGKPAKSPELVTNYRMLVQFYFPTCYLRFGGWLSQFPFYEETSYPGSGRWELQKEQGIALGVDFGLGFYLTKWRE